MTGGSSGVAARSVQQVRLHSVTGQRLSVDPGRTATVDLLSRKIRLRAGRVVAQVVTWSVDSVHALPGVAVRTASQRFDPFTAAQWPLRLEPVAGHGGGGHDAPHGRRQLRDRRHLVHDRPARSRNRPDRRPERGRQPAAGSARRGPGRRRCRCARVARLAPAAPFQRHLMVALAVSRPVSLTFTAPDGQAVPVGRVTGVQLTGGADSVQVGRAQLGRPVPLLASVGKLVGGVWTPEPVTYAVAGVAIEGADAVFAGQQRFRPVDAATWPIAVSVFDVSVTARDVLFGSRLRSTAYVSRPDGVRFAGAAGLGRAHDAAVAGPRRVHRDDCGCAARREHHDPRQQVLRRGDPGRHPAGRDRGGAAADRRRAVTGACRPAGRPAFPGRTGRCREGSQGAAAREGAAVRESIDRAGVRRARR